MLSGAVGRQRASRSSEPPGCSQADGPQAGPYPKIKSLNFAGSWKLGPSGTDHAA